LKCRQPTFGRYDDPPQPDAVGGFRRTARVARSRAPSRANPGSSVLSAGRPWTRSCSTAMPRTGGNPGHTSKRHSDKMTTFPLSRGSVWTHSGPLPSVRRDLCRRGSAHRPRFTTPRGNGACSPDPQPSYRCAGAVRLADRTEPRAPRSCSPAGTFCEAWIVCTIQRSWNCMCGGVDGATPGRG